jgi:(E)-4-hydroxy-3-methylbut-2-enyl-diphosphate synthase
METSAILPLYCKSLTHYKRRVSSVVNVGDVPLGGSYPIRVQSMTTTDTMDTQSTVEQSVRMIEAGCDYVRITAPSIKEAENLKNIKNELRRRGYKTPLVADIHFTPNAAEAAARIVEKVRINPGNYADKKRFEHVDYSDEGYLAELDKIRQRFTPLLKICKEYGTAMRIGVNHGSLSDRIMSRYGDTPRGMVESAMEFLRICGDSNFSSIVLSMKSSNPQVMVQAYRLLVQTMNEEGMNFPLHLGVTEAGEGEDGRIKSAAGIGALLEDGLGDTIRVSLTEDPEFEVPVAKYWRIVTTIIKVRRSGSNLNSSRIAFCLIPLTTTQNAIRMRYTIRAGKMYRLSLPMPDRSTLFQTQKACSPGSGRTQTVSPITSLWAIIQ